MLGAKEIKEILPHRYPFLMIDRVEEVEEGVKAKLTILYENNKELQLEIFLKNNVKDNESILEVL